eukprot:Pompholyxophrys_sp_v1_NODE_128_length_1707_cov_2.950363.p1 type:complete len:233 gc:universal NODE_128_length_1707_cov_2.950363:1252-554(-)
MVVNNLYREFEFFTAILSSEHLLQERLSLLASAKERVNRRSTLKDYYTAAANSGQIFVERPLSILPANCPSADSPRLLTHLPVPMDICSSTSHFFSPTPSLSTSPRSSNSYSSFPSSSSSSPSSSSSSSVVVAAAVAATALFPSALTFGAGAISPNSKCECGNNKKNASCVLRKCVDCCGKQTAVCSVSSHRLRKATIQTPSPNVDVIKSCMVIHICLICLYVCHCAYIYIC